jgi:hypothetical protein
MTMSPRAAELQRQLLGLDLYLDAMTDRMGVAERVNALNRLCKSLGIYGVPLRYVDEKFLATRRAIGEEREKLRKALCMEICRGDPHSPECEECRSGACPLPGTRGKCACGCGGTCGCGDSATPPDAPHDFGMPGEALEVLRWLGPGRVLLRDRHGREAVGELAHHGEANDVDGAADDAHGAEGGVAGAAGAAGDVAEKSQCGLTACDPPDDEPEVERTRPRPGPLSRGSLGPRKALLPGPGASFGELRRFYKSITRRTDKRGRAFCFEGDAYHRVPCGDEGGAGAHGGPAPQPAARRGPTATKGGRLARTRDVARRRRVLAAFRAEAELAAAVEGLQWPDSEAQDVSILITPGGELVRDLEAVRSHLRVRADLVRRMREGGLSPDHERQARAWLDGHRLYLFECKTVQTQKGEGEIRMSARAAARKQRLSDRLEAPFLTVALDLRRRGGERRHALYYRGGVGNARLSSMERVADYQDLLSHLQRETTP